MLKGGDISVYIYICICLRVGWGGGGSQQCGRDILGGGNRKFKGKFNLLVKYNSTDKYIYIYIYLREVDFG